MWSILDYVGVGVMPLDMAAQEFEHYVRTLPRGLIVSWDELKSFAESLEEAQDILIVAAATEADFVAEELQVDDFSRCTVVIEALDSWVWSISTPDEQSTS